MESSSSLLNGMLLRPLQSCLLGKEERKDSTLANLHQNKVENQSRAPSIAESSNESNTCDAAQTSQLHERSISQSSEFPLVVETNAESVASDNLTTDVQEDMEFDTNNEKAYPFFIFRLSYLFVTLVVMLADGLQGTHLYVLYEGYGFSVASLYCLGFFTGAVTAPITGPLIDKIGRKKSALIYCALEVGINLLEQFPFLSGLIVSRVVGGVTTNLLSTVFETWVDTEYRSRGFAEDQYETLMRDYVVVSNLAAIASGYLAHVLAEKLGPVGPFEGAVTCTAAAFAVVFVLWTENYGALGKAGETKSVTAELKDTISAIKADSRVLRVCITQGLTMGSLHIFIFLWSPILKDFADGAFNTSIGLDGNGEPAYGLVFGWFMTAGVIGGLLSPSIRKVVTLLLSPLTKESVPDTVSVQGEGEVRPMAVEFQAAFCYVMCSLLLLLPSMLDTSSPTSFSYAFLSFVVYEFLVGVYSPCEGVIRSLYIPPGSRGSILIIPRIIVNVAVALAVVSTEFVTLQSALGVISTLMLISGVLQLTLISKREWLSLFGRIERVKKRTIAPVRSLSMSVVEITQNPIAELKRCASATMERQPWFRRGSSKSLLDCTKAPSSEFGETKEKAE